MKRATGIVILLIVNISFVTGNVSHFFTTDQNSDASNKSAPQWGKVLRISELDGHGSYNPELAIDTKGNVHVIWYDDRANGLSILYRKYLQHKHEWLPIVVLTNESEFTVVANPLIKIDQNDYIHVSWNDERNGKFIYRYCDGIKWSEIFEITEYTESNRNHESIVNNNGSIYFFWNNLTSNGLNIFYREYSYNTEKFSTIMQLTNSSSSEIPSAAVDSQHRIHIAWSDKLENYSYYEVFYQYLENGKWYPENPILISDDYDNYMATAPSIAVDDDGNIFIVWDEHSSVFGRNCLNGLWLEEWRLSGIHSAGMSDICLGVENCIHVVYEENYWIQYISYQPQIGWSETYNTSEPGRIMIFPKIAVDNNSIIHLVWNDYSKDKMWEVYYLQGKLLNEFKYFLLTAIISPFTGAFILVVILSIRRKK